MAAHESGTPRGAVLDQQSSPPSPSLTPQSRSSLTELGADPGLEPEPEQQSEQQPPEQQPELEPEPEPEQSFDRYGLAMDSEHAQVYSCESEESVKEAERESKWVKMLDAWELYAGEGATKRRAAKLKRRVRKGIPVAHRGRAWCLLCGAREQMAANAGVYHDLAVVQPCEARYENQIRLDISRTITDHQFFRQTVNGRKDGQEVLYRVLRAYAVYNHKVAYCQGMSYIAGMFLCQGIDEEEGFWMLRQFMNEPKYNLCGLYEDGFPLLNRYLETLTQLLFERYPDVAAHVINREGVVPIMFAEKWLLTLFMYNWPYKVALRMWDVIIMDGPTAFFGFALSVFELSKSELLQMDTEQLLLFLTANTDDGGFARVITAAGVDWFMERALKLEVGAAAIKEIETIASEKFRKEALAASPALTGRHHRQRSIESSDPNSPDALAMRRANRTQGRRRGGGTGGGVCGAKPVHD